MAHLKIDGAINSGGCIASLSCGIAHSALQLGLLQVWRRGCMGSGLDSGRSIFRYSFLWDPPP